MKKINTWDDDSGGAFKTVLSTVPENIPNCRCGRHTTSEEEPAFVRHNPKLFVAVGIFKVGEADSLWFKAIAASTIFARNIDSK